MSEKNCKNCLHYARYYTILKARLCYAHDGHCRKSCDTAKQRKAGVPCKAWQPAIEIEEKYNSSFRSILEKIAKSLEELALIINRDDKSNE